MALKSINTLRERARCLLPEGERGGVILVSLSVDPEGLKAPLPWRLPYIDTAGAVEGGVIILPSGAPIEVALTTAMLPAPAD